MRPKLLKMTAFGPYAGEEIIDFEKLEEANMFLIYGPTGGGKTTILDAICYALYGETNGGERSGESMRSKFASEDEVTEIDFYFKLRKDEYRILRRPQYERPSKRGTGTVKEASVAELYKKEDANYTLISAKYNEVAEKVAELLHFNIGQFRQVIMIAQNKFRELLTVSSKERQQILQDIFETGIYQNVEKHLDVLYTRSKEAMREKQLIYENILGGIESIEDESMQHYLATKVLYNAPQVCEILEVHCKDKEILEAHLHEELIKMQKELETYREKLGVVTKQYEETQEKEKCKITLESLKEKLPTYEALKIKIEKAQQALTLLPLEENVMHLKKEASELEERLGQSKLYLEQINKAYEEAKEAVEKSCAVPQEIESLKKEYSVLESYQSKVLSLSEKYEEKDKLDKSLAKEEEKLKEIERRSLKWQEEKEKIEEKLLQKDSLQRELTEKLVVRKEIEAVLERKKMCDQRIKERELLVQDYRQVAGPIKEKMAKLQSDTAAYDLAYEKWLGGLAGELAKGLEENNPCPVCGSTHHPQKAALSLEHVTREKLDALSEANKKQEAEITELKQKQEVISAKGMQLKEIIEELNKELEGKEEITVAAKTDLEKRIQELEEALNTLGKLQESMQTQINEAKVLEEEKERNIANIGEMKLKSSELTTYIKAVEVDLPETLRTKEAFLSKIEELKVSYTEKENIYKLQVEKVEKLTSQISKYSAIVEEQTKQQVAQGIQIETKEKQFVEAFLAAGFDSEESYSASKQSQGDTELAKEKYTQFIEKKALLEAQCKALEEKTKDFSMEELESVKETHSQLVEKNTALAVQKEEAMKYRKHHEKIISELMNLYERANELAKKQGIIEKITMLSKGKNKKGLSFERYIQSSIFEEVLHSANKKLKPMTQNRYELYRTNELSRANAQAGLDIGIMDYYSNETRPVNTLSGGESFMAALALALGLSEVIQRLAGATPLDTLFIDEGFGSLDEEALDLAVKTLLNIQDTGRLIGIISHVRELREQIPVGLEITTGPKGSHATFKL